MILNNKQSAILINQLLNRCLASIPKFYTTSPTKLTKQRWSDTELNLLKKGVKLYGRDWWQISEKLLPERSPNCIRSLWDNKFKKLSNLSNSKSDKSPANYLSDAWTPALDDLVKLCVQTNFKDWDSIKLLHFPKLSKVEIQQRYKYLMINRTKRIWSSLELDLLFEAIELLNDDWGLISDHVQTRSPNQCQVKFLRYIKSKPKSIPNPSNEIILEGAKHSSNHTTSSQTELINNTLDELVSKYGPMWNIISMKFPINLSPSQLKARWHHLHPHS